jgi:putative membrane protein
MPSELEQMDFLRLALSAADAQMMPYGWHMHEWMSGWGPWPMIFSLVFWIAVLAGIGFLAQKFLAGQGRREPDNRALDVLAERYAKGEIDREEYLRRRHDIIGA